MSEAHAMGSGWEYQFEAAISLHELNLSLDDYDIPEPAFSCLLSARSARAALCAVLLRRGENAAPLSGCNLVRLFRKIWNALDVEVPAGLQDAARMLSQVLVLTGTDAGHDHVSRDLYSSSETRLCASSAARLLDASSRLIFGIDITTIYTGHSALRQRAWDDPLCWRELLGALGDKR